jgi:hypothetical protein
LEQVLNENQMSEAASGKYSDRMTTTKRYDPKHRALAEAERFRVQMEAEEAEQPAATPSYAMEAQCGAARPAELVSCRGAGRGEGADCQYARGGEGRRALATPVPDPDFMDSRPAEDVREGVRPAAPPAPAPLPPAPPSPPPPSLLHLASCASEPLHTPEKAEVLGPPPPLTPARTRTSSSKTEAQQLFLTPKEKYAKRASALSDTAKHTVAFDINQELDIPKENESPDKPTLPEEPVLPVKRPNLTMRHILRAKKKMASQKKLILEHGEVRLTPRQRLRIRPVRKRVTRKLQANDVFHRTDGSEPGAPAMEGKAAGEAGTPAAPVKKRIVNRKDKLLAEHRSQSQHADEAEVARPKPTPKRLLTCPICGVESTTGKDHFQHIKVSPSPVTYCECDCDIL